MTWRIDDPQGNEAEKIKYEIVKYTRGRGLDLGCGPFKAYPHFIGVDNGHHWGNQGVDVSVKTCEKLDFFATDSMDFVFSSHLLEHLYYPQDALLEWMRVIKPGGYLVLYLPHADLYPCVGEHGANPDHKIDLWPHTVIEMMREVPYWDLVVNEARNNDHGPGARGNEYSFYQVYQKLEKPDYASILQKESWLVELDNKPRKKAAVVRYGGFGDMIQASSILPGLKAQGFHITFYTTPRGHDILKTNPYIDEFYIQDPDQVPNNELSNFWYIQAQKYHRFINLSESVEGTLLAMPGRTAHRWPHTVRHNHLNVNYLEFTHELAQVPFKPAAFFYPTPEEIEWAHTEREKMGKTIVAWSLSGSSVHKAWPWTDNVVAKLMLLNNDIDVVFMGDTLCQILEEDWRNESRVHRTSGRWSIRQSLTFCLTQADVVVGPETGVLNAVGLADVAKVIMLSHSSTENLTKHWLNTTALWPLTGCYPCHMMHYNFNYCRRDEESGAAQCQADISFDSVYQAIRYWLDKRGALA